MLGDVAGHPGKPNDITTGGSSWTGASPYNIRNEENAPEMQPVNPWPPSTVQIVRGRRSNPRARAAARARPARAASAEPRTRPAPAAAAGAGGAHRVRRRRHRRAARSRWA